MNTTPPQLGSEIFCQSLAEQNVELMFGIPGGVVLPLYDRINQHGHKIRHILPRQEQGGGFAADGYARVTGKTGVALGTSGPGATNLMTSIANSMLDSIPVIYVTGQVAETLIGTDAFQETDVIGMTMPIVKHSYFVSHADEIQRTLKESFHIANTGRPGPVHIDITKDAWLTKTQPQQDPEMDLPGYNPTPPKLNHADIKKLDQLLEAKGTRPVIIAGHGIEISKAQPELHKFATTHNIPVVNTLLALGNYPQGDELWCGMVGMHGDAVANLVVHNANLIIGIGCRFEDRITGKLDVFTKDKKFVHMEIDQSEINKIVPADLPLLGDAKEILTEANKLLSPHKFPDWHDQIALWKSQHGFLDFTYNPEAAKGYLSQARIVKMLSDITNGEAIVAGDVGRHQMWLGRFYRFRHPNSHLSSGGLGSMGYGVPSAMGAKLGRPDREVWAISGDGGFTMNMQELGPLAEHNIPVKIGIMEDGSLGMVRQWQNLLFKGNKSHSILHNPDFVKLARSFGIPAWRAETYEEARKAIEEAREVNGPTLITFMVDPQEHVYPMVPPNTPLGDQALRDSDLLENKTQKYDDKNLVQGHT